MLNCFNGSPFGGEVKKLLFFLITAAVLAGCQQKLSILRPPLEDEGEVYIYLQPMPQEADKLRFTLEEVNAVKDDGTETPLTVHIGELKGSDIKGQRLFLSGRFDEGAPPEAAGARVGSLAAMLEEGARALDLRLVACGTDLRLAGFDPASAAARLEVTSLPELWREAREGRIVSL